MAESNAVAALQTENARLTALLDAHGIEWRLPPSSASQPVPLLPAFKQDPEWPRSSLSTADKVALFRRLFRGRTDVRIIDFVDTGHPALLRMWDKRQRGYRAMGYRVAAEAISDDGASSASAGGSSTYKS